MSSILQRKASNRELVQIKLQILNVFYVRREVNKN